MRHTTLLTILLLITPAGSTAGPLTQDACEGSATTTAWLQLDNDVLENLLFAAGSLWVSDGTRSSVLRFEPDTSEGAGMTGIPSPGGLAEGADGTIYAGWGNSLANAAFRTGEAKVVGFDPSDPDGTVTDIAGGFHMPNGMTFLPDGSLAISNDLDYGLNRVDIETGEVTELAHVWGANGLVVTSDGSALYAAITFDQRSPIARVSLGDTAEVDHDIQLTFGAASLEPAVHTDGDASAPLLGVKGLDDMTRDGDGTLYVTANGTGELLRVDPATGDACLVTGGLQNPSSVRIAPEDGGFADGDPATIDLYVTEFSGAIRLVRYAPAA